MNTEMLKVYKTEIKTLPSIFKFIGHFIILFLGDQCLIAIDLLTNTLYFIMYSIFKVFLNPY